MFRTLPLRVGIGAKCILLLASKRGSGASHKSKMIRTSFEDKSAATTTTATTTSAMALACLDMDVSTPISKDAKKQKKVNLSDFHPGIAATWVTSTANKLLQPQHVLPSSRKLVWWQCPACKSQYTKRIDLHVAAGGECPSCHYIPPTASSVVAPMMSKGSTSSKKHAKPALRGEELDEALTSGKLGGSAFPSVAHRARTHSTQGALAAENENRIKKSVADNGYLRLGDTRNLQPMLAKNYLDVMDKISDTEELYVSPKLDGVRCIAAFDAKNNQALFFSRAGTLFECCDVAIEPALQVLFQTDPTLVLDGELYNHSESNNFEQLISAIRTSREKRTKAITALQKKLQYHVFDVLYSKRLQDEMTTTDSNDVVLDDTHAVQKGRTASKKSKKTQKEASPIDSASQELTCPFSVRYQFLEDCVAFTDATNGDSSPIKLVRAHRAKGEELEKFLHKYIDRGYEGVMVRRDKDGGYAYGSRSSNLLKYKLMQDDEFVIVGAVEGKGKLKNSLGAFVCQTKKGEQFTVSPATTQQNRGRMWKNWSKYKGKALTVQFQQLSSSGIPRFPIGKSIRGSSNGSDWL